MATTIRRAGRARDNRPRGRCENCGRLFIRAKVQQRYCSKDCIWRDPRNRARQSDLKRERSRSAKLARSFELAKKSDGEPRFLQIVAKDKAKLTRVAFSVSRLMEFCTARELQNQTGHSIDQWPLVVFKEIMDNALDEAEEAEVAPIISVDITPGSIVIQDNGRGIETETIKSVLNYNIRVSSREAYVSPTRGQQGNALKTILAMGYVLDRERPGGSGDAAGRTIIEARGIKHCIEFCVDHINNQPKIAHITSPSPVTVGTRVTIEWTPHPIYPGGPTLLEAARDRIFEMAEGYTWVNPHLSLHVTWEGEPLVSGNATDPAWAKWGPRDPTSAHWYSEERLQRYLAAHVSRDRDQGRHRTVREFIAEFRGCAGSAVQRRVLEEVGCSHQLLAQFFGIEKVNREGIAKLLAAMQKHTKPVAPKHLGVIGSEHLRHRFLLAGGNDETFKYDLRKGTTDAGIPYIIEVAFGLHQSGLEQGGGVSRRFVTGANWSVGINNPFRAFGSTGEGLENTLADVRANRREPVICAVHLASAYIQYADRGKSSIILTDNVSQSDG